MNNRSLFEELKQGIEEINDFRAGTITLKTEGSTDITGKATEVGNDSQYGYTH